MKINHPSERDISDASLRPAELPAKSRIEAQARCTFITSKSSAKQLQQTSTDEGQVVSGKAAISARDGSLVAGTGSRYAEQGSIQSGGAAEVGTIKATGGDVNLGLQGDALANLVGTLTQASGEQAESAISTIQQQNARLAELAEGKQGDSKTILYVVGAAFAALVLIFLFKR